MRAVRQTKIQDSHSLRETTAKPTEEGRDCENWSEFTLMIPRFTSSQEGLERKPNDKKMDNLCNSTEVYMVYYDCYTYYEPMDHSEIITIAPRSLLVPLVGRSFMMPMFAI